MFGIFFLERFFKAYPSVANLMFLFLEKFCRNSQNGYPVEYPDWCSFYENWVGTRVIFVIKGLFQKLQGRSFKPSVAGIFIFPLRVSGIEREIFSF